MPSKESPLVNFLLDALMYNKYPDILFWLKETEGIFCLRCICKYQKKKWSEDTNRIFVDYHKLKPRKSENERQTLLLALKASPSIETLKKLSSKEKKFYKFLNKTKILPFVKDSGMLLPCKNKIAEIFAKSPISISVDLQYSELKNEAVETPYSLSIESTNFKSVISAPNENGVLGMEETLKDLSEILGYNENSILNIRNEASSVPFGNEASAVPFGDEASAVPFGDEASAVSFGNEASAVSFGIEASAVPFGDEASAVPFGDEASAVSFGDEASTVPDSTINISEYCNDNISQSMFVKSFNANRSCNSNLFPDVSDLHEMENQAYSDDYDPILDLYQSIENKKTCNQEIPVCFSESPGWEVKGVYSVNNDVVKLLDKGDETVSDHFKPNYYMMVLKSSKC